MAPDPRTDAVIVATARSPIGRAYKGSLRDLRSDDLAASVISTALGKVPQLDPTTVDDLYLGCGLPGGEQGFNLGRVVAVLLGLDRLPAATVTRYCASSLQTTRMAFHAIRAGEGDAFISAGVECVSRFVRGNSDTLPEPAQALVGGGWHNPAFDDARDRSAKRSTGSGIDGRGDWNGTTWHDPREDGALPDAYLAMGQTAENLAQLYGVGREEMDEFGVRSQNLAERATADGFWAGEITPVELPDGTVVSTDDGPRPGVTMDGVAGLKPVFRPDGRVTAGNCCPLNDGAAAVVVMSAARARDLGITPLARIVSTGVTALSPEIMGLGPVAATRQALGRAGMSVSDVDLFEINEAFAAQVIPSYRQLDIPLERLNVMGGAIAVGHPFGMTGARITGTLLNALQWHDRTVGVEAMCVGGGQGMAMVVERLG
jgi:acetyl-CoA C-acetyltransferase